MGGATAADYAWLRDRWTDGVGTTTLCVNFVASLSPGEALRRFGVTPGTSGDYTIAAYEATGGTVLAETGWATSHSRQYDPLSARTKAATVYVDIKGDEFTYCPTAGVSTRRRPTSEVVNRFGRCSRPLVGPAGSAFGRRARVRGHRASR